MRRPAIALLSSLGIHVAVLATVLGVAAWRGLELGRGIAVVAVTLEVEDLPLDGAAVVSPRGSRPSAGIATEAAIPRRRLRPKARATDRASAAGGPDAGAQARGDAAATPALVAGQSEAAKARQLGAYGPEGSRLTALLRLDRLLASPEAGEYIAVVDQLLRLLPDRRRLLDGTGLDLYRDFDALLIATPNPLDDSVTFLAARHKLDDEKLRAALDRGAAAGGMAIEWRTDAERPVGVRRSAAGAGAGPDDRVFVLPQPGLAVIAPPAYAKLLLAPRGARSADAGTGRTWTDLVARIDAEDGVLPENAVVMMTAANLLRPAGGSALRPVPGTRGTVDDDGPRAGPSGLPEVISLVAGTAPTAFVEISAEFAQERQAAQWEVEWPALRQKILGNPLALLAGLGPMVSRAELGRDTRTIVLRTTATGAEIRRVIETAVGFARAR